MTFKTSPPLTVLYRGTLEDTAVLVGLVHACAHVGLIAFTGDLTDDLAKYCEVLSRWLRGKGLPRISIHPMLTGEDLKHVLTSPLGDWGWGAEECIAAIHLACLPTPPITTVAA